MEQWLSSMWPETERRVKNPSQLSGLSSKMDTDGFSNTGSDGEAAVSYVGLPGHGLWDAKSMLGSSLRR